ncbi:MAG: hypothetical protein D6734_12525 [Candidatus Schekmanbacteria bacterium]|nr:MAG: hypothetical protein D6734_12525 [Candidatus Schekmanbacteria bacterium]
MGKNKILAEKLKELEGYERRIIAFKLYDELPVNVEPYGDDISFHCAIVAEMWEEGRKPFYITNKNIMCGGAVYSGIGNRKVTKEEFDAGMASTIGFKKGYSTRKVFRRVNQQIPHHFIHHKYQVIGALEDVENPDIVMIVTDAYRVMRLTKAYTWKTGELVQGVSGSAWCTNSFPIVFHNKTITFNMGDEQARCLMNLNPGEVYCTIHYDILPLIVENLENIQTGIAM